MAPACITLIWMISPYSMIKHAYVETHNNIYKAAILTITTLPKLLFHDLYLLIVLHQVCQIIVTLINVLIIMLVLHTCIIYHLLQELPLSCTEGDSHWCNLS